MVELPEGAESYAEQERMYTNNIKELNLLDIDDEVLQKMVAHGEIFPSFKEKVQAIKYHGAESLEEDYHDLRDFLSPVQKKIKDF